MGGWEGNLFEIFSLKKIQAAIKLEWGGWGLNGPASKKNFFCGFPNLKWVFQSTNIYISL